VVPANKREIDSGILVCFGKTLISKTIRLYRNIMLPYFKITSSFKLRAPFFNEGAHEGAQEVPISLI
jgi:hypothetical protein